MIDLVKSGKLDRIDAITITGLINKLSVYWILCNGVRFLVDFNKVSKRKFDLDTPVKSFFVNKANKKIFEHIYEYFRGITEVSQF